MLNVGELRYRASCRTMSLLACKRASTNKPDGRNEGEYEIRSRNLESGIELLSVRAGFARVRIDRVNDSGGRSEHPRGDRIPYRRDARRRRGGAASQQSGRVHRRCRITGRSNGRLTRPRARCRSRTPASSAAER